MKVLTPAQAAKAAGRELRSSPPLGPRPKPKPYKRGAWGFCPARSEKLHLRGLVRCSDCGQHNPRI